jgi:hypothetical protein
MKFDLQACAKQGFGNVLIMLADFKYQHPNRELCLPEPIDCVEGFVIDDDPNEESYTGQIFMNPFTMKHVHTIIRDFVRPPPRVKELVDANVHGCRLGVHIRRAAYGTDSKHVGNVDDIHKKTPMLMCSDDGLQKFIDIIERADEPIFLASDSLELKKQLAEKYPKKIRTYDVPEIVIASHEFKEVKDATHAYVDWFLLSQCTRVCVTAGSPKDLVGFSTFGYTAAVYGHCDIHFVWN